MRGGPKIIACALFLWLGLPLVGRAQVKEVKSFSRDMQVEMVKGRPVVSVTFDEVFTPRLRHRLSNGFTSRILIDIVMSRDKKGTPLAQALVQYTIIYDIWEERFNVREETPGGRKEYVVRSMKELIRNCGTLREVSLNPLLDLPAGTRSHIKVRITVNPTSRELRRKVRRYMANPGGHGRIGSPQGIFTFSWIFMNEKDIQADMVYTYKSQRFDLPAGEAAD